MREGWEVKKLGEISKIMYGYTAKSTFDFVGPKYLRITDIQNSKVDWDLVPNCNDLNGEYEKYRLKKGDIVFARTGATTGKSFLIQDLPSAVFASYLIRVQLNSKMIVPDFIYHFFQSSTYWKTIEKGITGSAQGGFNASKLSNLSIPIPPLSEQQYIVSILDKAFAAIDEAKANTEKNLNNAKELFQSQLNKIFSEKGKGWVEKKLENSVDERCSLSYGIVQPGEQFANGLPVIRPTDLTKKFIQLDGLKLINPELAASYKRTALIGGELLLCVRGSTGIVSIATAELKGANVTRGIVPICFNADIIDQQFGYYLMICDEVQKQIKAKTYGAALMQINIRDLRKIIIALPSLKEQQKIVSQLNALSTETKKLEALYQQKLVELEDLKKSILEKAFKGELTEKELAV